MIKVIVTSKHGQEFSEECNSVDEAERIAESIWTSKGVCTRVEVDGVTRCEFEV